MNSLRSRRKTPAKAILGAHWSIETPLSMVAFLIKRYDAKPKTQIFSASKAVAFLTTRTLLTVLLVMLLEFLEVTNSPLEGLAGRVAP